MVFARDQGLVSAAFVVDLVEHPDESQEGACVVPIANNLKTVRSSSTTNDRNTLQTNKKKTKTQSNKMLL